MRDYLGNCYWNLTHVKAREVSFHVGHYDRMLHNCSSFVRRKEWSISMKGDIGYSNLSSNDV